MPRCCSKPDIYVYASHFLSAWGDRMWSFGVGIFLIHMTPESLQLTGIYGLCMGFSVLLFGAFIGDIVDNTPRLKAAQVALVFQNSFVVINAVLIYLYLIYRDELSEWAEWSSHIFYAITIILSILSLLNSIARSLAVEKDWIVELCKGDKDALATMTASLRRIDLTTQVLAPVATGLIMGSAGVESGALFIGGWNLVSVVAEYYLLWKVYNTVPALRAKKKFIKAKGIQKQDETKGELGETDAIYTKDKTEDENGATKEENNSDDGHLEIRPMNTTGQAKSSDTATNGETPVDADATMEAEQPEDDGKGGDKPVEKKTCCSKMLVTVERLYKGWPLYAKYPVAYAGMGLACMFLTVLGLDNVTVGYAKMQGVTEEWLGVMQGVAAFFGIAGTLFYPTMRKRLGLIRTGIFGFSLLVLTLVPCVISIWMPGSPFDLSKGYRPVESDELGTNKSCTEASVQLSNATGVTVLYQFINASVTTVSTNCPEAEDKETDLSIWMLLAGIVTARFGLWIADLSITQLFLEEVKEEERGKVNGVQKSLNQLMDLLKFVMVILIPYQHQFGLAILISFSSICVGWCFYAHYLRKIRGHLLPHCQPKNGHIVSSNENEPENVDPGAGDNGIAEDSVRV